MQRRRIDFTPVPLKARHDGWTPVRQRRFIHDLAATKSITRACRAVGMSAVTAYALRKRPGAESFAAAWDRAITCNANAGRRPSPRPVSRVARLARRPSKANEVEEMHGPPISPPPPVQASSAFAALDALLAELRGKGC